MARDWLTDQVVTTSIQLQQPVLVDAKFLRRGAEKFLLKGMRLPGIAGAIDFNGKIILRKRLDELAAANVNTLILSEAQAEAVLGVAGQAGLAAPGVLRELRLADPGDGGRPRRGLPGRRGDESEAG